MLSSAHSLRLPALRMHNWVPPKTYRTSRATSHPLAGNTVSSRCKKTARSSSCWTIAFRPIARQMTWRSGPGVSRCGWRRMMDGEHPAGGGESYNFIPVPLFSRACACRRTA
jgi:hypothetical protein